MMQDIPDLLKGLKRTPNILIEFVNTIHESKLTLRRGNGFWTIAEHVSHLAEVQPMLLERFQRFTNEEHPQFIPFNPSKDGDEPATAACMNMTTALLQFEQYRTKQLILLENAGGGIWQRMATHPEYDQYSLYILTRHVLMHDYWHMYRIEELWLTKDSYLTKLE
jgi:hypothetical protein